MPPRWKTCTREVDRIARRSARPGVRPPHLLRRHEGQHAAHDRADRDRHAARDRGPRLDGPRRPRRRPAQAPRHPQQDRLPRHTGATTPRSRSSPTTTSATSSRATNSKTPAQWHKLGKPVDLNEWGMTPPTVNAYFNPQMNDINFPAGVLQPPLYDPKLDDAPNYGNTGATIGHELTHAFDDEGRQFDANGNLKDWWTPADAKGFEDRINCVRDQYAELHHRRRHPHQLQAHQRRRRSRHRRNPPRLHRLEEADRRPDPDRRATASPPTSASSSAWRSGPARTSGRRTCASAPSPTRTLPASRASTA